MVQCNKCGNRIVHPGDKQEYQQFLNLKNKNFTRQIFDNKKLFIILGVLSAFSTILAFSALGGGSVGIVSTILKTQLLFVLLFSFIFFKDRPKLETIIGSINVFTHGA